MNCFVFLLVRLAGSSTLFGGATIFPWAGRGGQTIPGLIRVDVVAVTQFFCNFVRYRSMLCQLTSWLLGFFILFILSFPSYGRHFRSGLVLWSEGGQGLVVGGGDGSNRDIDLSGRIENPIGSFEDSLVSFLCKRHVTYVGANLNRQLVTPYC